LACTVFFCRALSNVSLELSPSTGSPWATFILALALLRDECVCNQHGTAAAGGDLLLNVGGCDFYALTHAYLLLDAAVVALGLVDMSEASSIGADLALRSFGYGFENTFSFSLTGGVLSRLQACISLSLS
jgi:hypothetical protein